MQWYLVYMTGHLHESAPIHSEQQCTPPVTPCKIPYLPRVKIHGSGTGSRDRSGLFSFPPLPPSTLSTLSPSRSLFSSRLILILLLPSLLISSSFPSTILPRDALLGCPNIPLSTFTGSTTRRARLSQIP